MGPGEYTGIRAICVANGDSIVVFDGGARVTVLSSSFALVRQISVAAKGDVMPMNGCLSNGTMLFIRPENRSSSMVELVGIDGRRVGQLSNVAYAALRSNELFAVPFAIGLGQRYLVADPYSPLVEVRNVQGGLEAQFRIAGPTPTPPSTIDEGMFPSPTGAGGAGRPVRVPPSRWPLFTQIARAADSTLWFRTAPLRTGNADEWIGMRADGTPIGRLILRTNERSSALRALAFLPSAVLVERSDAQGRVSIELFKMALP
jgi:hypothetical protein